MVAFPVAVGVRVLLAVSRVRGEAHGSRTVREVIASAWFRPFAGLAPGVA